MKKIILLPVLLLFCCVGFSQNLQIEPELPTKSIKRTIDSLSKYTDKKIVSYLFEEYSDIKITTIFYIEDKTLKSMVLSTTSKKFPLSDANRTVNVVVQTVKSSVFSNN